MTEGEQHKGMIRVRKQEADIYKINQLEAMRIADTAWHNVNITTICNCWQKAGILPDATLLLSYTGQPTIPISVMLPRACGQMLPNKVVPIQLFCHVTVPPFSDKGRCPTVYPFWI